MKPYPYIPPSGNIFIIYATLKVRARSHDAMTILLIRVLAFNDLVGGLVLYPNFILLLSKGYFPFNATVSGQSRDLKVFIMKLPLFIGVS